MSDQKQDGIYIPARTIQKIHLFANNYFDEDENNTSMVHFFENVVLVSNGSDTMVAYNMLDILASTGNVDQYELLVGHAIPKAMYHEMVSHPWMIYQDARGDLIIEIQQKGHTIEYTVSDKSNPKFYEVYQDFVTYDTYQEPGGFFPQPDFLTNLGKMFNQTIGIKHRAKKVGKKDETRQEFLTQAVGEHNPWVVVYRKWYAKDLGDYPFGSIF